jgi:8-oxo-dGTP pyrophosphatase MutT (NUDIX family)
MVGRSLKGMYSIDAAPCELQCAIREFWPETEWDAAASIAYLESAWNAFAVRDTTDASHPCGAQLSPVAGVPITAEMSVGYFQINACDFPSWEWQRLYNARHNAGTAHMLWSTQEWAPWLFSAQRLGLLP